jgi:hypothetical protein
MKRGSLAIHGGTKTALKHPVTATPPRGLQTSAKIVLRPVKYAQMMLTSEGIY